MLSLLPEPSGRDSGLARFVRDHNLNLVPRVVDLLLNLFHILIDAICFHSILNMPGSNASPSSQRLVPFLVQCLVLLLEICKMPLCFLHALPPGCLARFIFLPVRRNSGLRGTALLYGPCSPSRLGIQLPYRRAVTFRDRAWLIGNVYDSVTIGPCVENVFPFVRLFRLPLYLVDSLSGLLRIGRHYDSQKTGYAETAEPNGITPLS